MDLLFDLPTITSGIASYDQVIGQLKEAMQEITKLQSDVSKRQWSGDGKAAFDKAVATWLQRTQAVAADVTQTRESLADYAANQGGSMKQSCENFGNAY